MTSIYDAMPIKVLEELERIDIAIPAMERRAFMLQADAQDLRLRTRRDHQVVDRKGSMGGLDNLIAERHRLDMLAWHCDPLPSGIRTE